MRFLFAVLLFFFFSRQAAALNISDYRFHIMPETSYYGGIHSITKDSVGRIWFSGHDAVYVFNGNSFTQMNDLITAHAPKSFWRFGQVITDRSKRLYIGTNEGLLRFNYKKQKFDLVLKGNIATITVGHDGLLWLIRDTRIESFQSDRLISTSYPALSEVSSLVSFDQHVYVSSKGKLYKINSQKKQYELTADLKNSNYAIRDVIEHNGSRYILTHMHGLYECQQDGTVLKHYDLSFAQGKSTNAKSLYMDSSQVIWIASQYGLFLIDTKTKEKRLLRSNLHYAYSLPNNSVWSIYPDPDGGVWIGTYGGKLAYMTFFDNDVNYFKPTLGGLNHPIVSSFEEDEKGNLWIGTEGGGLNFWNRQTDRFSYFTQEGKVGIISNMIKNLHYDLHDKVLRISTFNGGMGQFEQRQQRFIDLNMYHPNSGQQLSIYDFAMESDSGIWLTNPDSQLIYKDKRKGTTEVVALFDQDGATIRMKVETLYRVSRGDNLWLMTHDGVYIVNVHTRRIIKHYRIENAPYAVNNIWSYCMTTHSEMWFGTRGGGVNRLSKDGKYVNYGEKDGLYGKTVFGILEDNISKEVWFSTNDGLYYFDYKTEKIHKFRVDIAKLCGTFYVRSCFKTAKGEMLFGATNGFIMFTPHKIKQNNVRPKVFFTDLLINNKKVVPGIEDSPLQYDISTFSYTDDRENKIVLSYDQSNIELRMSTNSYLQAEKNQYAYRMQGLSDQWYTLPQGQQAVHFSNLPAGKYIFDVKATNNDGVWGDDISSLYFEVKPSPFFSVWAYMMYGVLLLCIVYFIWRYFTNKKIFEHRLEMEQLKEQNMKKLTQARINFFTNISHDLKTPLTLVVDPLKQLKELLPQDKSSNANSYVHLIEKNVNRIQRMISQLLQFREIESQKITVNPQPGNLIQYIGDIFSLFDLYANKKGIETEINTSVESFYTRFDHDIIEKVFTNVFSNAIKYTVDQGYVGIAIAQVAKEDLMMSGLPVRDDCDYISVAVTNTGGGIPEDKKEAIFEAFNRLSSGKLAFEQSTGLGLSIVKELVSYLEGKVLLHTTDTEVTFTVVLPFLRQVEKTDNKDASYEYAISEIDNILAENQDVALVDKRKRKLYSVVIIEDDTNLRSYMEQRLSEYYNVYTATNGKEGIAKAEKIFPQIVVTDLMMPEADGFDVCKKLRSNIKTSHIPIVMLSGLGKQTENKIKALENGANVFIDKPFDMEYLLKQVDNLIKNQNELKESYSKKFIAEPSKITISSTDEALLKKAMENIEKNISNIDYNVEAFVSDMGIGRTLLYQKINDILGMSIKEFIMDIRLKRGAQLLEESDLTISEIAYMIGFNNPKHFSVCFKKQFDFTPSEFRKRP